MSTSSVTAQQHLADIAEECAGYYDRDDKPGAIACFASRVKDHPETAHIAEDSFLIMITFEGGWAMGRQGIINTVTGFAV